MIDTEKYDPNEPKFMTDSELKVSQVFDLMAPHILYKVTELESTTLPFKVNDLTDIVYCYSRARQFSQRDIFEILSDKVANLIKMREDFKLPDVSKLSWSISRYYTNSLFPNYNADISSMIQPRDEFADVKATKHRNFDAIFSKLNEKKDKIEGEYLPMTLYAMASVGYDDKSFFDTSILTLIEFVHNKLLPEDIGYAMQAMAMNNLTEYNSFFADALRSTLPL